MDEGPGGGVSVTAETIQNIIKERGIEVKQKTEQLRQDDRNRIKSMKSTNGVNPLDIFPKEIWKIVFDKCYPKDRWHVSGVHEIFRDLQETTRIRDILFPQLVGLEVDRFWEENKRFRTTAKHPLAHYVKLREVSKSMRDSIDKWFENNLLQLIQEGNYLSNPDRGIEFRMTEEGIEKVKRAHSSFSSSTADSPKRLFSKSLSVTFSVVSLQHADDEEVNIPEMLMEFKHAISSMLECVGSQIWHFECYIDGMDWLEEKGVSVAQIYFTIQQWLRLMPKLKWIQLLFMSPFHDPVQERPRNTTKASVLQNQLPPRLPDLRRIDFNIYLGYQEVTWICEAILEANQHIKTLHFVGMDYLPRCLPIPLVQSLNLESFAIGQTLYNNFEMDMIERVINFNWKLQYLHLCLDAEYFTMNYIFRFLEKFQSLEKLSLNIINFTLEDDVTFLRLPNLTDVEFNIDPEMEYKGNVAFFFSLQFLLHSKKLKSIKWKNLSCKSDLLRCIMDSQESSETMIQFGGGWRDLRESNIWDIFPSLEHVKVDVIKKIGYWGTQLYAAEYRRRELVMKKGFEF